MAILLIEELDTLNSGRLKINGNFAEVNGNITNLSGVYATITTTDTLDNRLDVVEDTAGDNAIVHEVFTYSGGNSTPSGFV
jgi:hypothetical protein